MSNSLAVNNNGVAVTGSNITVNCSVVLTTDTSYTKSQVDSHIALSSQISAIADLTVGTLSTKSATGLGIYYGTLKTASINNSGLLNCVTLSCSAVDLTNSSVVSTTDGLTYTQF